ncbi:hypothetical protein K7H92_08595 [Pseudomonas stutzeri]|nr:hypothetical protein [Stutzerimonas stutzeri]
MQVSAEALRAAMVPRRRVATRSTGRKILNDGDKAQSEQVNPRKNGSTAMLKFLGSTVGIIFLIGLIVVFGLFALIF